MIGTVRFFKSDRGFGFVQGEDGKDYFCHFSDITGEGFKTLREGQNVEFDPAQGPKGPKATNVTAL
jgi:cold shock protein